jgi:hypothetical protein
MFDTDIASVLSGCWVCLQWFQVFSGNVSDACFKCFICLQTYVASVVSGCLKSRSGVAYLPSHLLLSRLGASSFSRCRLGIRYDAMVEAHRESFRTKDAVRGTRPRVGHTKRSAGASMRPEPDPSIAVTV